MALADIAAGRDALRDAQLLGHVVNGPSSTQTRYDIALAQRSAGAGNEREISILGQELRREAQTAKRRVARREAERQQGESSSSHEEYLSIPRDFQWSVYVPEWSEEYSKRFEVLRTFDLGQNLVLFDAHNEPLYGGVESPGRDIEIIMAQPATFAGPQPRLRLVRRNPVTHSWLRPILDVKPHNCTKVLVWWPSSKQDADELWELLEPEDGSKDTGLIAKLRKTFSLGRKQKRIRQLLLEQRRVHGEIDLRNVSTTSQTPEHYLRMGEVNELWHSEAARAEEKFVAWRKHKELQQTRGLA